LKTLEQRYKEENSDL
jgi:chromosome segregation ATPase